MSIAFFWDKVQQTSLPALWRYVLLQYCKTLGVSAFGFLIILLSTRLEEVAKLISLGAPLFPVLLYIFYQIPYMLQLAIPISTLVASVYLFQRLSQSNELTAIRAAGIGLYELLGPIIIFSSFIAAFFFSFLFDLSAEAHLAAKQLEFSIKSQYPIALLQNSRLLQQSGMSLDMKGSLKTDGYANDLILATNSQESGRSILIVAKEVSSNAGQLHGHDVSLISISENKTGAFDTIFIDNAKENLIDLAKVGPLAIKRSWKASNEMLSLPQLLAKRQELQNEVQEFEQMDKKAMKQRHLRARCTVEIARRAALAFSIITFSLFGMAFGVSIGRYLRKRLLLIVAFAALFLVSYLAAKAFEDKTAVAITLYIVPNIILIAASLMRMHTIQKGSERI